MIDYKQFFQEKIAELPDIIRESIEFSNWEEITRKISERNKLHLDQGMILEESVSKLIIGVFDGPEFVRNMFENAHISTAMAGDILLQVDKEIMTVIKDDIEHIENIRSKDAELERLIMGEEKALEKDLASLYAEYFTELDFIDTEIEDENDNDKKNTDNNTLDIERERQEILEELERENDYEENYIKPDHQISNIHIEKPISTNILDSIIKTDIEKNEREEETIPKSAITKIEIRAETKSEEKFEEIVSKPLTKNINFNDVYREPIE